MPTTAESRCQHCQAGESAGRVRRRRQAVSHGRGGGGYAGQALRLSARGRRRHTHRGEEAGAADAGYGAGAADALGGLRGEAAQALVLLHGPGGRAHDDALVVLEAVWVWAGLGGLVQDRFQLVACVAAF